MESSDKNTPMVSSGMACISGTKKLARSDARV